MNKHLQKTRMQSVIHYQGELKKLREALNITEVTRNSLLKDLVESCPFEPGDIIVGPSGSPLYKFRNCSHVNFEPETNKFCFFIHVFSTLAYNEWKAETSFLLPFSDIGSWSILTPKKID